MTPEEVELLSELTIVIPTYNRPLELERAIEYWRDTPVTIHILDGSQMPCLSVGSLPSASNITYHHFPIRGTEGQKENYLYRIKFGVALSKTKFSALCPDDDIFLLKGIVAAIKLLQCNNKIDSVTGQNCEYLKTHTDVCWIEARSQSLDSEKFHPEISRRIFSRPLIANYYGIFKTEIWIQIHESQTSFGFRSTVCSEFLTHYLISILCRNYVIDSYMWVRNHDHPHPSGISDNQVKFGDWVNKKNSCEEINKFVSILSINISIVDPSISSSNADKFVRFLLSAIPRNRPTYSQIFERKAKSLVLSCLFHLPKTVRHQLFVRLPDQMQERLGSDDFQVNFKPKHFLSEEFSRTVDFENWKNILLMQREELRLRVNI